MSSFADRRAVPAPSTSTVAMVRVLPPESDPRSNASETPAASYANDTSTSVTVVHRW